jgi:serine/threonine protein kinase/WD40 repeat protein
MTESSSRPSNNDDVMAQFFGDLERRGSAIIDDYKRRYPQLSPEFDDAVRMQDVLGDARPDSPLEVPARLGGFRIIGRLSRGGMGELYEAEQEPVGRRVVVKIIRRGRISPQTRDRFLREQEVLAKLHQTNIVPIYATGEEGRLQFYAMPYIDGAALNHVVQAVRDEKTAEPGSKTPTLVELAAKLARTGAEAAPAADPSAATTGPVTRAAEFATGRLMLSAEYFRSVAQALADVAEAVHHAHGAGILHRDLKPSNVMVDRSGHCWVIDFGLAGYLGRNGEGVGQVHAADCSDPAVVSGVMGTPNYMAPEQFDSKADARSDVWALGATLYELLTLRRAFSGESFAEVRAKVLEARPVRIEELTTNVPADLAAICRKALRKAPAERYQTAMEFAKDLRSWLNDEPTSARPAWFARRAWLWAKRNKWRAAAVLLSTVAFLLGALTLLLSLRADATAAQVRALQADVRAKAADADAALARQEAQERDYEVRLLQQQRARFGSPIRWSKDRLDLVSDHYKGRPDNAKRKGRDEAAATLAGLDAVTDKELKHDAGSLAFSKDGKRLVLGGVGRFSGAPPVKGGVYDRDKDRMTTSEQLGEPIEGPVAFTTDGVPLQLVAVDAYRLRLWDVDGQRSVREFTFAEKLPATPLDHPDKLPTLALSADGRLVAASTKLPDGQGILVVWVATTGKEIARAAQRAQVLAFSPDNALLATGDGTGAITMRPLNQLDKGISLQAGRMRVHCLAFTRDPVRRHKDGREASSWLLAAGEAGGGITIWDVERKIPRMQCLGSQHDVYGVAFSPDGTLLASVGRGAPRLWDAATGRLLLTLKVKNTFTDVAFSRDGQFLAVSAISVFQPGGIEVYVLDRGRGMRTLRGLRGQVIRTWLAPDDRYVAALSHDWQVGVWDFKTGWLLHVFEAPIGLFADNDTLAFSTDGRLACASWREAVLWELAKGGELRRWDNLPPGLANQMAFHPSGKLLLFREETEDMRHTPDSTAHAKEHPRACRIRDLLAKDPKEKPIVLRELNWHIFDAACPRDGSYFVVRGLRGAGDKREDLLIVYDGLTGNKRWHHKYEDDSGLWSRLELDPTGKLLAVQMPGEKWMTLVEMPTGTARGSHPAVGPLGPGAEWWLTTPPEDTSHQFFGFGLRQRGEAGSLVTLGTDTLIGSDRGRFNVGGTHVAWGNADGTVTLCDIQGVRRRLAAIGLGW